MDNTPIQQLGIGSHREYHRCILIEIIIQARMNTLNKWAYLWPAKRLSQIVWNLLTLPTLILQAMHFNVSTH